MDINEIRRRKVRGEELTDEEFDALSRFWKSGESIASKTSKPLTYLATPDLFPFIDTNVNPDPPDTLRCSFCGVIVNRHEATEGTVFGIKVKEEMISAIPLELRREVRFTNDHVVACPTHCLYVQKTKFPHDEG
jgi:hypothetical protein